MATHRLVKAALVACAALMPLAAGVYLLHSAARPPRAKGVPVPQILPQPPLTEFAVKPVREAWDALDPAELVLGISVAGETRAYPINVMNEHPGRKLVNDTVGGRAIAACW
jgi:hypothetical protein